MGAHRDSTGPELTALVERTQAAAVVLGAPPATVVIRQGRPAEAGEHGLSDLLALPAPGPDPPAPSRPDDTALLLLTSGTTGTPKAVMETRRALWAKMQLFADAVSPGPDDVQLMYLPVNHVFGLKLSLMALASGGRLVLQEQFSPSEALRLVDEERVTILPGTPTHLKLLLGALGPARPESVRWAISAAAPIPPDVVEDVHERLGAELLNVYGCSEGFLTLTTDRDEARRGSVGRRVFRGPEGSPPDGSIAILPRGHDTPLPPGELGEIAFGTSRPVRYWGEPPAAAGGAYRTGDLGWLDKEGRLFVWGRLKEVVNRGGLKVGCAEVESPLARCPGVGDCAVIPTPDGVLGEAICACVVASGEGPPSLTDVRAHLRGVLGRQKLPDELCVLESIPRSAVGKIDRAALAALVVEGDLPRARQRATAGASLS